MQLNKRIASFKYAIQGLILLFRTETNAQIHLAVMSLVIIAGIYFQLSQLEWILLILCFGAVIGMEAMNTALEKLTDLASPEKHPLAGQAKDLAAGAVLWLTIMAIIVGLMIFLPKILTLLA